MVSFQLGSVSVPLFIINSMIREPLLILLTIIREGFMKSSFPNNVLNVVTNSL